MHHEIKNHYIYYTFLAIIIVLGITLALQMTTKGMQMAVVILTTFLYIGGGIVHHALEHDINAKIVIEYILIGSLGMSIVLFLLQGYM